MVKRIKSLFLLKTIFSYLPQEVKFKLVRNNKAYQKKINLNFLDYKLFSGKYIIYEEKGKVKEYNSYTDDLIFEGGYLNNKRNGKGKEYNNKGELIFEGEYLNGIKWEGEYLSETGKRYNIRKGIKYLINDDKIDKTNEDKKLVFKDKKIESTFKDGKEKIKEYDVEDDLIFEGDYLYKYRNGKGKEYYKDKSLLFEGDYINGKRNGFGKEYYNIINISPSYIYLKFLNKNKNIIKYEGDYLNGKRNGKGKEYNTKGQLIFEGEYLYNSKKKGKAFIKGKLEFEGDYLFNKKFNGNGFDKNGNIIYQLKDGNGKVKEYNDKSKLIFKGEYLEGKRNVNGKEYNDDGYLIYKANI